MKFTINKSVLVEIGSKFRSYCEHATIHGVYYFVVKAEWWVSTAWTAILGASIALCVVLSQMIWEKFVFDPTVTVVESINYPVSSLAFPTVTVCDPRRVYGPNSRNITNILLRRGFGSDQIADFYNSFSDIARKDYVPDPNVKKMHALLEDLNIQFFQMIKDLKKPCDVLIVECAWRSIHHNCTSMFREVLTMVGYCCQFDLTYFRLHASQDTNFVPGLQTREALDITVDGSNSFSDAETETRYVELYVSEKDSMLTPFEDAVTLTAGVFFDITLEAWVIDSSDDVKALSRKLRKCSLKTDSHVVGSDSYEGCITNEIMKRAVDYCRCLPFNYKASDEYSLCNWDRYLCVYQILDNLQGDFNRLDSQNICYQKCDYIQYDTKVDYVRQLRSFKNDDNKSIETASRVVIHFTDTTCLKYRREVLYTWDQMLAFLREFQDIFLYKSLDFPTVSPTFILGFPTDFFLSLFAINYLDNLARWLRKSVFREMDVKSNYNEQWVNSRARYSVYISNLGGIFGLCLGGSIISIMEIIWLLLDVTYTLVTGLFVKKVSPTPVMRKDKLAKNQIFMIKQKEFGEKKHEIHFKMTGKNKYPFLN